MIKMVPKYILILLRGAVGKFSNSGCRERDRYNGKQQSKPSKLKCRTTGKLYTYFEMP